MKLNNNCRLAWRPTHRFPERFHFGSKVRDPRRAGNSKKVFTKAVAAKTSTRFFIPDREGKHAENDPRTVAIVVEGGRDATCVSDWV